MSNLFTLSDGDVAPTQSAYQRILEGVLKQLLEFKTETQGLKIFKNDQLVYGKNGKNFINNITGTEGELLNPGITENLRKLRDAPVGTVVESAPNIKIEFEGKVIIESDQDGKVITNSLQKQMEQENNHKLLQKDNITKESLEVTKEGKDDLQDDLISSDLDIELEDLDQIVQSGKAKVEKSIQNLQNLQNSRNPSAYDLDSSKVQSVYITNESNNESSSIPIIIEKEIENLDQTELQSTLNLEIQEIIQDCERFQAEIKSTQNLLKNSIEKLKAYQKINQSSPDIETVEQNNIQESSSQQFEKNSTNQASTKNREDLNKTPSERIIEAANTLENKNLKSLIISEAQKLQLEIKLLQQERNAYKEILQSRLAQPQKVNWWKDITSDIASSFSNIKTNISHAVKLNVQEFNKASEKRKFTQGVIKLFNLKAQGNTYEGKNYRIEHNSGIYTVSSVSDNRRVMQFRPTMTGTKILQYQPSPKDIEELKSLSNYTKDIKTPVKQNTNLPKSFESPGKSESQNFARTQIIADTLAQYAKSQGNPVHVSGKSNYIWSADPKGNVTIKRKDNQIIFQRQNGRVNNAMESRDISYFENSLPKLKEIIQHKQIAEHNSTLANKSTDNDYLKRVQGVAQSFHNLTQIRGTPLEFNGDNFYGKSNQKEIAIFRQEDKQLIFRYSHKDGMTHNTMTHQDLSKIEKSLASVIQSNKNPRKSVDQELEA